MKYVFSTRLEAPGNQEYLLCSPKLLPAPENVGNPHIFADKLST